MSDRHPSAARPTRRGITLVEVLLVIGVMVLAAAVVLPALSGPLERARLRRAADQVRTAWRAARVQAMRSGGILVFTYAPGDRDYIIEPHGEVYATLDLSGGIPSNQRTDPNADTGTGKRSLLPERVVFAEADGLPMPAEGDLPGAGLGASGDASDPLLDRYAILSDPIFFYPDGTTTTAAVVLRSRSGHEVEVRLRGLTGVASVGEVRKTGSLENPLP